MKKHFVLIAALLSMISTSSSVSFADTPGAHPDYVQAIGDLKNAKILLGQHDSPTAQADEVNAILEIDASLHDLTAVSVADGKNPAVPAVPNAGASGNRLARALELMAKAQLTIDGKEDDVAVLKSRASALKHLDTAVGFAKKALGDDAAKK
jgi:hypothetical protein